MKLSNVTIVFLCVGLIIAACSPLHGLTVAEQADAFYQRGLEAEKREDFIAAGNCYALTLRVNPGHVESLARLADLEKRNVFGAEAKAQTIILPALEYNLLDGDAEKREARFQDTLALLTRLTGLSFVLETEGEPIKSHTLNLREVSVETALRTISDQADLLVFYERDVIRLAPKSSLPEPGPETKQRLAILKDRLKSVLASAAEPRRENLVKIGDSIDAEFATLAESVKGIPNDLAAVKVERSKAAYTVRSEIFRGQPGSFTDDAEGWTMYDTKGAVTQAVEHHAAGYLGGTDLIGASDYFFAAPESFLELVRKATVSDSISFDFYTTASDVTDTKAILVVESPGMNILLPEANPPIREWKRYTCRFDPSAGWKVGEIGKKWKSVANANDIQRVLANATRLYLRGEWKTGPDMARLDNVFITSGTAPTNPLPLKPGDPQMAPKPSLTSVAPFAPDPPAATPTMPQKEPAPAATKIMPFRDWLATVKFEQNSGQSTLTLAGEQWRVEQNKTGKTFLWPIVSIEETTRTITWRFPDGKVRSLQVGEGRDKALQKDGAQFKVAVLASIGPTADKAVAAMEAPALAPGQPDPRTDFEGWLKTVQLKHGLGDGVIWSFEDGVVLHYSQTDPNPKVQRFEVLSIDSEARTMSWKQPGSEHSIRISNDFTKYEWMGKDKPFVPQALAIEPRDPAIFGPAPAP